jgi:hypothetical protein
MKHFLIRIWVAMWLIGSAASALAWSGPGHIIAAAWAYRELTPAQQQKLDAILQQHPKFAQWQHDFPTDVPGLTMDFTQMQPHCGKTIADASLGS